MRTCEPCSRTHLKENMDVLDQNNYSKEFGWINSKINQNIQSKQTHCQYSADTLCRNFLGLLISPPYALLQFCSYGQWRGRKVKPRRHSLDFVLLILLSYTYYFKHKIYLVLILEYWMNISPGIFCKLCGNFRLSVAWIQMRLSLE